MIAEDEFALVFDAAPTHLRIQKVGQVSPHPYTGAGVEFERFEFLDQDARRIWTAPGGPRVAWFKDPDGNLLSLAQMEPAIR